MRKAKVSRIIVIDACVARQTGRFGPLLTAVRDVCHRVGMSGDTMAEWERQERETEDQYGVFPYARMWRREMAARRKYVRLRPPLDVSFRKSVIETGKDPTDKDAIEKDMRLIEASLVADRIVISVDKKARDLMSSAARACSQLREIVWVNPEEMPAAELRKWLQAGAPPRDDLKLGANQ